MLIRRAAHALGNRLQNAFGNRAFAGFAQQQPRAPQIRTGARFGRGQLYQRIVFEYPVTRHIIGLGIVFAKSRQLTHHGQELTRGGAGLNPTPGILRLNVIGRRISKHLQFFRNPMRPATALQIGRKIFIDPAQMGNICQGIGLLRLAQWAARPISKARAFVDALFNDLAHQCFIAHLIAKATDHGRDLSVKQGLGKDIGIHPKDFEILPRSMEDFDHRFIAK